MKIIMSFILILSLTCCRATLEIVHDDNLKPISFEENLKKNNCYEPILPLSIVVPKAPILTEEILSNTELLIYIQASYISTLRSYIDDVKTISQKNYTEYFKRCPISK